MKIAQEFKDFISRGNVVDLAVGVIIGASFGKIVNSLVMDMIMPQMDGIEASKSIRSIVDARGHYLPILGLSANVNSVDRDRFIQAGADDFLLKPYDRQPLVEVTERLLFTSTHATQ